MEIKERIQVIIEKDGFRDALYFTAAERAALTEEDVAALAAQRFENYKAVVSAPPAPARILTEEEMAAELESLEAQRAALDSVIATKSGELTAVRTKTADPIVRSK